MDNTRYYLPSPWPTATYSDGLSCVYEIRGLRINERKASADSYRVLEIGGLDGADIRDAREVLPGMDGEEVYDSFYGGRTIILTGRMQAGNWAKLQSMKNDLLAAVNPLVEAPLYMLRFDFRDHFDYSRLSEYTSDGATFNNLLVSNGVLSATSGFTSAYVAYDTSRLHEDHSALITITPGQSITNDFEAGVVLKHTADGNYVYCFLGYDTGSGPFIGASSYENEIPTDIIYISIPPLVSGTSYRLEGRITGNIVTVTLYDTEPDPSAPFDGITATGSAPSGNESEFGTGQTGYGGWRFVPVNEDTTLDNFEIVAGSPPFDVWTKVRKFQPVQIKDSQKDMELRRDFLLTLRASDPRFLSKFLATEIVGVATSGTTFAARTYNRTYDLGYNSYVSDLGVPVFGENTIVVTNHGNYNATPIIRLRGEMTSPKLTHRGTGRVMEFAGTIPPGDHWDIDVANRTILDGASANKFSALTYESEWIELEPGENVIDLSVEFFDVGAEFDIYYRHSWM